MGVSLSRAKKIEGEVGGMDPRPQEMSLSLLQLRCSYELNHYQADQSDHGQYCLEIFKRAINQNDNAAWMTLQDQFSNYVLYWLRSHAKRLEALQFETEQNYVDDTFMRLWQWGHRSQREFHNLGGALKFLHLCLNSSVIDSVRRYAYKQRFPLREY